MVTTIQLDEKTKSKLTKLKNFPRESYDDVVKRLVTIATSDSDVLSKNALRDLQEAIDDVKKGRLLSHEHVKKKHGL